MQRNIFLPESMYGLDSEITLSKLKFHYKNKDSITVEVLRLSSNHKFLIANLGNDIIGRIPIKESTIYPVFSNNTPSHLSNHVLKLIGKMVRVKIKSIQTPQGIILSRKKSMLEALKFYEEYPESIRTVQIISFTKSDVFVDVGEGIKGKIKSVNFSPTAFQKAEDVGFKRLDCIDVKVTNYRKNTHTFYLSRILPNADDLLKVDDIIECKVFDKVPNDPEQIGYYILYDTCIKGIVDSRNLPLNYGDIILARVKSITPKGLKLERRLKLS